jgi:hypothetical protein
LHEVTRIAWGNRTDVAGGHFFAARDALLETTPSQRAENPC